jgi:hypothetical protein
MHNIYYFVLKLLQKNMIFSLANDLGLQIKLILIQKNVV